MTENTHRQTLRDEKGIELYVPLTQRPEWMGIAALFVRPKSASGTPASAVRRELQGLDRELPFVEVRPIADALAAELHPWRTGTLMFGLFGALAFGVALVGLYGTMVTLVQQRSKEMGIRLALGAETSHLVQVVFGSGLKVVLVGIVAGLACALIVARRLAPLLFDTPALDPLIFTVVPLAVLAATTGATLWPSLRAGRIAPASVLRDDSAG